MRISLLSMPWAIFNRPSIQLGALKAYFRQQFPRYSIDTHHLYLSAARVIGLETYGTISAKPWAGEALYSRLFFPQVREKAARLFHRELDNQYLSERFDTLGDKLEKHLFDWLDRSDLSDCNLVGFSICFNQLLPSLYAAKMIKERYPELPILFGGSTCAPAVAESLLQTFSTIDFIITGEGEQPLAGLIQYLSGERDFPGENIVYRQQSPPSVPFSLRNNEKKDLNDLPPPDYDDYFHQLTRLSLSFIPELPIEFSRGCWWNKCAFCNLNLQWCGYRFKDFEKMYDEVEFLSNRYQCLDFFFTDNALPPRQAKLFFQRSAKQPMDHHFFAEVRASNSLKDLKTYRYGGLTCIQIGIEALSDSLLQRLNKGTTVLDNIAVMKNATMAGILLEGNLILEFPGSTDREVEETLAALDAVFHYRPLQAAAFFLGQGSPICIQPKRYGIHAITQHPNNRLLFPEDVLSGLNLLMKGYRGDRLEQRRRWQPVRKKMAAWADFHANRHQDDRPALSFRDGGNFLLIRQERPNQAALHHRLKGLSRKIYLACDIPVTRKELLQRFKTVKEGQLTKFLSDLENKNLMYCDSTHCLALAIRTT